MPWRLTRPYVGFIPTTPQSAAGLRIDPDVSPPVAAIRSPAASAAPEPLLDPPGVRERSQGLVASANSPPPTGLPPNENSGRFNLPTSTPPAAFMRATTVASKSGTKSLNTGVLAVVLIPFV